MSPPNELEDGQPVPGSENLRLDFLLVDDPPPGPFNEFLLLFPFLLGLQDLSMYLILML